MTLSDTALRVGVQSLREEACNGALGRSRIWQQAGGQFANFMLEADYTMLKAGTNEVIQQHTDPPRYPAYPDLSYRLMAEP